MSTDLVHVPRDTRDADPSAMSAEVVGSVHRVGDELVVRLRPSYRDAMTRPMAPRPEPTTLAGVGCMRYVGPCVGADAARVYRTVEFCQRHPFLGWLRGWTRR